MANITIINYYKYYTIIASTMYLFLYNSVLHN